MKKEKRKRYSDNWELISLYVRKIIANDKCQFCGVQNGSNITRNNRKVKIALTVAHLNHNESDNRGENLKALCQKCHLNYDRQDNTIRKLTKQKLKANTPHRAITMAISRYTFQAKQFF